jgi:hypothetical protein
MLGYAIANPTYSGNQKAQPDLTPNFLRIIAMGQNPVNADCNKLAPTKAVNHSHNSE